MSRTLRPLAPLALVLLAVLAGPAAQAQASFPSTPPEPGEPQPFELPEGQTFALDNGVDVTLLPYGSVPKASVYAVVRAGNVDEGPGQNSTADLVAALLTEGTAERSAEDVAAAAARMGGSLSASAGLDQTTVGGRVLSEFTPDLVRLVAEVLREPAFPAEAFERVQRNELRGAAVARSQPGSVGLAAFRRVLYGEHPYASVVLPVAADIEAATPESVRAFYEANVGPARTHLYVFGRFDEGEVEDAVREAFGAWSAPAADAAPAPPEARTGRRVVLVDQPGAAQSQVFVGIPTIDPSVDPEQYVRLEVTNALLGGSFGSRITRNIREDKGYTYSPSSSVSTRYRDAYWAQRAAVVTESTGPAIREILYEVDSLAANPPSAEELEGIQNYLAGTFVLQNSSPGGLTQSLAFLDLHGLGRDYLERYVERVYAVTPEDVQRTARELLRGDDLTIVVVGDRGTVEEQLAAFGDVEIETID